VFLHEIVEFAARRSPGTTALAFEGETWTFADLHDRVARVSAGVGRLISRGGRVALLAENGPDYVTAYYAVPRAGGILTLLNHRLHPQEWARTLEETGATVLVGERALLDRLGAHRPGGVETIVALDEPAAGEQSFGWLVADERAAPAPAAVPGTAGDGDAGVAWIIPTSGTTGRPKGAMLTHRSLVTAVAGLAFARAPRRDDVYLFPFPLCHVAGYNVLAFHLFGRPVVLMRRFDARGVLENIERHRATQVSLAPTMIDMLLDEPALDAVDWSSLRGIGYGASGIPSEVLRRTDRRLGCELSQGYGMTELSGNVAYLGPEEHRRAVAGDERLLRSAGRVSPLATVRIVDDEMRDAAAGEPGEIVVRGDQVTVGYWGDEAATRAAFAGGWFHTGDVGRLDPDGYLTIVDRKKDVIVSGGENIASREVEEVLYRHPTVKEVAVVGVPDRTWGEHVCAVVVAQPGTRPSPDELIAHCRSHLASYKKPRHIVFVDALPKNAAGKIVKQDVRAAVAASLRAGE
jgi:acyl-CoA synthetase (AMP-forming)/AMP-acid ligase II